MKTYIEYVIEHWFVWLLGSFLFISGYMNEGWIRMGIGVLIIAMGIKSIFDNYDKDRLIEAWLNENEGQIIFSFLTKKTIQNQIRKDVLPLFPIPVLLAYYDGPKIVGDLEIVNEFLSTKEFYKRFTIIPHKPSILKIQNGEFIVLKELPV